MTIDTGVARFRLTSQGASVRAVQLLAYHTTLAKGAPPVEIAPVPGSTTLPLHAELSMEQRVTSLQKGCAYAIANRVPVSSRRINLRGR